jgi:hypothetical protein
MAQKKTVLVIAIAAGLFAAALVAAFFIFSGSPFFEGGEGGGLARYGRVLREFDLLLSASKNESGVSNIKLLEDKLKLLEKLNKQKPDLQKELSLLKRKREYSKYVRGYRAIYEKELYAALKKYPATIQLFALAVEKELENAEVPYGITNVISAIHIGENIGNKIGENYKSAGQNAYAAETFLSGTAELFSGKEKELLFVDAALLSIILNGAQGGKLKDAEIVFFPLQLQEAQSVNTFRFAAEYAYDTGAFALSSRLFAALPEAALDRAADASFLSGDIAGASALWLLSDDERSLYNYAAFADDANEKTSALEKIIARDTGGNTSGNSSGNTGGNKAALSAAYTLYTRLLDDERAAAFLASSHKTADDALLDLELWRRSEKNYPSDRSLAEMWRLLGRHKASSEIYAYAAWYFARERRYDELSLLLKNARLPASDFSVRTDTSLLPLVYWEAFESARLHHASAGAKAVDTERAIDALEAYSASNGRPWFAEANIALYLEAEHSWTAALQRYYNALTQVELPQNKARILEGVARCHGAQGRPAEARIALEEALLLDPDNLRVRTSLGRR